MAFTSTVFLFLFLPLLLGIYFSIGKLGIKYQNAVLLVFSILFYYWGAGEQILIILSCILLNYIAGIAITWKQQGDRCESPGLLQKWIFAIAVLGNLAILGYFKYAGFFIDNLSLILINLGINITKNTLNVAFPLGISFFTFQAMTYIIDVYKGKVVATKNLSQLALYILLFPKVVMGPIVKYIDLKDYLVARRMDMQNMYYGVMRFMWGLSKKVLLANTISRAADGIFNLPLDQLNVTLAWVGALAYTLQIYLDFSAYSDMAIGLGAMFGFRFTENFNYPYLAKSVQDFWRRWHISLSTWFRDYLYISLGGNRVSKLKTYRNLLIVFLLTGLWHGASWTFIAWGLWHGAFMVLEKVGLDKLLDRLWKPFRHLYVMLVVVLGWVFFRAETFTYGYVFVKNLFGFTNNSSYYMVEEFLRPDIVLAMVVGIVVSLQGGRWVVLEEPDKTSIKRFVLSSAICFVVFILSIMSMMNGTFTPFIYFKF